MPQIHTETLAIAYETHGLESGPPVFLMHGFPDDVRAYDAGAPLLAEAGYRVIVPYLRGYGPTRFLSTETPRSGQQAALGADLRDLMDALGIQRATLAGYDWGGRACCIVAALWPERVAGLVTCGGYNVQNIPKAHPPARPDAEVRQWYQWYFNTQRGVNGLAQNRAEIARLLWTLWCPNYQFSDEEFNATAKSFDNPDYVDVVIHSYRHRHGNAPSDPRFDEIERRLARRPPISVPTVILHGGDDGVSVSRWSERDLSLFPAGTKVHTVPGAGHFLPREKPGAVAVVDALQMLLK
jgi:pimeloyl-ACP methyl ester carboxylesterase